MFRFIKFCLQDCQSFMVNCFYDYYNDRRKTRTLSFYESPSQNQMRTTPRMLKKSRESMVLDERCDSPGRSGVHPYTNIHHEQLRKTSSTPHLVQVPTVLGSSHTSLRMALNQIEKRKTIESLIWSELRRNDMGQYVDLFVKEEIDGEIYRMPWEMMKATLYLDDGSSFTGQAFGATKSVVGEIEQKIMPFVQLVSSS
uniref:Rhotekin-2 n=1 Tax=Heterorhabditis bacteriophora TaxID=37862 RepID=A0A1I7X7V9_HETBA